MVGSRVLTMRVTCVIANVFALFVLAAPKPGSGQDAGKGSTAPASPAQVIEPLDRFGRIPCDDELARLDNLARELQADPQATAYLVMYGPRRGKFNEARSRLIRMKAYVVNRRGIDASRVVAVDGGRRGKVSGMFLLVPPGAAPPLDEATLRGGTIELPKLKRRVPDCMDIYDNLD